MLEEDSYQYIELLKELIATPSFSREEANTAAIIQQFLSAKNIETHRTANNVYAFNKHFDPSLPSIILNSHHDTVKPNSGYTRDPFDPRVEDSKLYGLGSTDAGASLVSLIACFIYFHQQQNLKYNLVLAATAEEEISGKNGISLLVREPGFQIALHENSCAIIGEPTGLDLAIAEKGLLVLDCEVTGIAGHAARDEGDNAIYKAMPVIEWFRSYRFERESELIGPVKMTVTSVETKNKTHNIVPASCSFVVDIRVNELYTHEEIVEEIRAKVKAEAEKEVEAEAEVENEVVVKVEDEKDMIRIQPRSLRLKSTMIEQNHPLVMAGISLGKKVYGSPTLSDKALVGIPALKCGPGNSAQSHSADEYIELDDIKQGIEFYTDLIKQMNQLNHTT